jgi:hypothetical protein
MISEVVASSVISVYKLEGWLKSSINSNPKWNSQTVFELQSYVATNQQISTQLSSSLTQHIQSATPTLPQDKETSSLVANSNLAHMCNEMQTNKNITDPFK